MNVVPIDVLCSERGHFIVIFYRDKCKIVSDSLHVLFAVVIDGGFGFIEGAVIEFWYRQNIGVASIGSKNLCGCEIGEILRFGAIGAKTVILMESRP